MSDELKIQETIIQTISNQINTITSRKSKLIELFTSNSINDEDYRYMYQDLSNEIEELKVKHTNPIKRKENFNMKALCEIFDFMEEAGQNFEEGDLRKKREIVLGLGSNRNIKRQKVSYRTK